MTIPDLDPAMDAPTAIGVTTGIVTGTVGTVLGILNYLRDRPRIAIRLNLGMVNTNDFNVRLCAITIANLGRRPIYLGPVSLTDTSHFVLLPDSGFGMRLGEGDPPKRFTVPEHELSKTFPNLKAIRAFVQDNAGSNYCSWLASEQTGSFRSIRHWWNCRNRKLFRNAKKVTDL